MTQRTAVFISGGIRTYEFCLPHIAERLVKPHNADVFCYVTQYTPHPHDGRSRPPTKSFDQLAKELFGANLKCIVHSEDVEIAHEAITKRLEELEPKIGKHTGWVLQWQRLQRCLTLCPDIDSYTTCVRIRPDIGLLDTVPQIQPKATEVFGMYDWFMLTTPAGIKHLASLWNTYGSYNKEPNDGSHDNLEWAPETQVYRHLHAGGFRCYPIDIRTTIVRPGALNLTSHVPEHWRNIVKNYVGSEGSLGFWLDTSTSK